MWFKAQFRLLILLGVIFFCLDAGLAASQTPPPSTDCQQGYLNLLDNLSAFNKKLVAACSQLIRTGSVTGRILAAAYYNRSIALIIDTWPAHEQSKVEPALIDLEQAMRFDPNEGLLYTARGYIRHARADVDRAIVDYSEALRLSLPRNFVLLTRSLRGNAYMAKGEYDRAITDYDEAVRIRAADPSNESYLGVNLAAGDIIANRGLAWLMKGNIDRAAIAFDDSLKKAMLPKHPFAFYGRGVVRMRKGDRAGAERDLIKALALD